MQEDTQYYFDIADSLLKDLNATQRESKPDTDPNRCVACGSVDLVLCYADGCYVCSKCGEVAMQPVFERAQMFVRKFSNYKRIHHFHERVSQFMLAESFIPEADMCRIKEAFQKSGHASINKANIRKILRPLGMQKYIEKWLQIIARVTGAEPPQLSARVCMQLDLMFISLQLPFLSHKPSTRKNFLNYNYVFNRLLQKLDLHEFCTFFPLIKSKSKLHALDMVWKDMCLQLGWEYTILRPCKPFSINISN
jgi:hypothetical protein